MVINLTPERRRKRLFPELSRIALIQNGKEKKMPPGVTCPCKPEKNSGRLINTGPASYAERS